MKIYFWCAKLDHPTGDQHETASASGLVKAEYSQEAFDEACREANRSLDEGSYTIVAFNKVSG